MIDLLVIGAGPTGLTAAAEGARHGLSVRIIDANQRRSTHSKALVLHSRSLEIFTDMGFADAVREGGQEFRALNIYVGSKRLTRIDFRAIDWQDAIYPYWLSIPQSETERHLEEHLAQFGVRVERHTKLIELTQQADSAQATLATLDDEGSVVEQEIVTTAWVIGCDGARSTTRQLCDIAYEGTAEDETFILGDVLLDWDQPEDEGYNFMSADGILLVVPMPEPKRFRIIAHMPNWDAENVPEIDLDLLQQLMNSRSGMQSELSDLAWHSSFSVKHLVAAAHRKGRVFLAGDAAHIHSPVGGQGLNTGIQDAYNLMWKLALVHQGQATPALLDSYQTERHAVAEATIKKVSLATKLVTLKHPISRILRNQLASIVINTDAVQNRLGRDVGMLEISYDEGAVIREDVVKGKRKAHAPKCGQRAPNVLFLDERGNAHSLIDSLYGTSHTLLLFAGMSSSQPSQTLRQINAYVQTHYASTIRVHLVMVAPRAGLEWDGALVVNADGAIHRSYGATEEEAVYLIRPDHHICYRAQPVSTKLLSDYLDQILMPTV